MNFNTEENKPTLTIDTYLVELVSTEHTQFENFNRTWITVPTQWVKKQCKLQGFESLQTFLDEYTYDDSSGWLTKAIKDDVLIACGVN